MFNLTVDEAHTFYVGQNGWLVHNCGDKAVFDALKDMSSHSTDDVLDYASQFLGKKQVNTSPGIYMSDAPIATVNGKPVYARVRITDSDLAGHGGVPSHANFELVTPVVNANGRTTWKIVNQGANNPGNKHIIFNGK